MGEPWNPDERSQAQKIHLCDLWFHLCEMSRTGGSSIEVKVDLWLPGHSVGGDEKRIIANGSEFAFGGDENTLELVVVVAQHCKCTKWLYALN